jgi:acetyl esterase/lipase
MMIIKKNSKNYIEISFIDQTKRDLILVLPGGAYEYTSDRESWVVTKAFSEGEYHEAVFCYREEKLVYPDIHVEAKALLEILKHHPLIDKIILIGFSAGGHFAAMLSTLYYEFIEKLILCYPVITANPRYAHMRSLENLIGENISTDLLENVSLEKHIHPLFPPTFIMHTITDESVGVENSLMLIESLKANKVYQEAHFYPTGRHGLSIVSKEVCYPDMNPDNFMDAYGYIGDWVRLAKQFIKRGVK